MFRAIRVSSGDSEFGEFLCKQNVKMPSKIVFFVYFQLPGNCVSHSCVSILT